MEGGITDVHRICALAFLISFVYFHHDLSYLARSLLYVTQRLDGERETTTRMFMLQFYASLAYTILNLLFSVVILRASRLSLPGKFYTLNVIVLAVLGASGYVNNLSVPWLPAWLLGGLIALTYSFFPFLFLHFVLVFLRRYELFRSRLIVSANYAAGLFSFACVLLDVIPIPFTRESGVTSSGYIYYLTWMSILFVIGIALMYSLVGRGREITSKSRILFAAFLVLMLLLPTPFTLSVFSAVSDDSFVWFFTSSVAALGVTVYVVLRYRIITATPYETLRSALDVMGGMFIKTFVDLEINLARGKTLQTLGYDEADVVGRKLSEFIQEPELLERDCSALLRAEATSSSLVAHVRAKGGSFLPLEMSVTSIYVENEVVGFVVIGIDLSERERAVQMSAAAYRISQASDRADDLHALMESVHAIINTVMPVNNFYIALYHPKQDRISIPYFFTEGKELTIPPVKLGHGLAEYVFRTGKSLLCDSTLHEELMRSGDCERLETPAVIWLGVPLILDHATIGVMVVEDRVNPNAYGTREQQMLEFVSTQVARSIERKRSEDALRASEEKYRDFFEEDLTGDAIISPEGIVQSCNPAFARIFGFSSVEAAMQANVDSLYPDPGIFGTLVEKLKLRKRLDYYEEERRRVDGTPVYVVENVIGRFDARGELLDIKTYSFDNTERRNLEYQLQQAQKMETLGTLAGGIAHDFNNILTIISLHAVMIENTLKVSDKQALVTSDIHAIAQAVTRGAGLIGQLLTFARKTDAVFEPIDLNILVKSISKMLEATFPKTVIITLDLDRQIPPILADSNQMSQAVLNLCVNARDAMGRDGTLTLRSRVVHGGVLSSRFPDAGNRPYVYFSASDTGTGMDEQTLKRIFEPFFTTKEKGKGTGLGLAVVYGVVRSHQGFIEVDSEVGKGSTFHLYIPATVTGDSPLAGKDGVSIVEGTETVLLVEDEEMILRSVTRLMEDKGYTILTAHDGVEAVEVFRSKSGSIAVVVTDMGLPGMSGWDAFARIREINPRVPVIFASGYLAPDMKANMAKEGNTFFIQKPYVPGQLLKTIREVLDQQQS